MVMNTAQQISMVNEAIHQISLLRKDFLKGSTLDDRVINILTDLDILKDELTEQFRHEVRITEL